MINLFENGITNVNPSNILTSQDVATLISSEKYRQLIQQIRDAPDKAERNKLKVKLDYVTPGGTFSTRSNNNLIESSGFAHLDIDNVPADKMTSVKEALIANKHTHLCHLGPSGDGFKVWVKIPSVKNDSEYKEFWESIRKHYRLPNNIDLQAKDISRACFVSWDPDTYFNKDSELYLKKSINTAETFDTMNFINLDSDIIPILALNWKEGVRQELAVSTVGMLRKAGYGVDVIKSIIEKICTLTNDKELNTRLKAITATFKKNEDEIKGVSGLKALLPEDDYTKIITLLNNEDQNLIIINPDEDDTEGISDIINKEINMEYIIENLIYPDTLTMLYSPPGEFKTMVAYYLALCIGSGKQFLNRKTKKKNVLFLDLENDNKTRKLRLPKMMKSLEIEEEPAVRFKYFINLMDSKQKINKPSLQLLENLIKKYDTDVIFIDTLHRAAEYKENNADDINRLYNEVLKHLIDKYHVSIVFLHHANKGGGYRGSSDFLGIAHVSLEVAKNGETMEFSVTNRKDGNSEIKDFKGKIVANTDTIELVEMNNLSTNIKGSKTESIIKDYVRFEDRSREDIFEHINIETDGTITKATVKKVLSKMRQDGSLTTEQRGKKAFYIKGIEEELDINKALR